MKKNKNNLSKYFELRLNNIISDCERLAKYPDFINNKRNTYKKAEIKVLRQTYARFIVDYNLQGGFTEAALKYKIEQL